MTNQIYFSSMRKRDPENVLAALARDELGVRGRSLTRCADIITETMPAGAAVHMTVSATAALETMAWALPFKGEIIMSAWNFSSTASALYRAGHKIVFVDCLPGTFNIDYMAAKEAINSNTIAILATDYGGVLASMPILRDICDDYGILLLEDAAPAYLTGGVGRHSHMAALSFNDTKNIGCGEGGALIVNVSNFNSRIEQILDKGTNVGEVRRNRGGQYTWTAPGSSGRMSELTASVLESELDKAEAITQSRVAIWLDYSRGLSDFDVWKSQDPGNGHTFWLMFRLPTMRKYFMEFMEISGIHTQRHYMALHDSPMAINQQCRTSGMIDMAKIAEQGIVRLPIYPSMADRVGYICERIRYCYKSARERVKSE